MRALVLAVVLSGGLAFAQSPNDIAQANTLFLEGRDLLTSKQTKAACEKFEASIALDPTAPGVMLNLGLCYELLEQYATSLFWFRKAQVAAAEARLPDYEDEAKRHTTTLANKVPLVKIDASAAASETEIRIDGKIIPPTDYARVEIDRGKHTLDARASGKQSYRKSFSVTTVDAGTLVIPELADERPPTRVPVPVPVPNDTTDAAPVGRIVFAAGFGAVGLGLAIASPVWARRVKHDYDKAVANGEMPSYSTARSRQHIATGMFAAGLASIGLGTYLYLTAPSGKRTITSIAPVIGGDQIGLAIGGVL